jgi:hypothetical protein
VAWLLLAAFSQVYGDNCEQKKSEEKSLKNLQNAKKCVYN